MTNKIESIVLELPEAPPESQSERDEQAVDVDVDELLHDFGDDDESDQAPDPNDFGGQLIDQLDESDDDDSNVSNEQLDLGVTLSLQEPSVAAGGSTKESQLEERGPRTDMELPAEWFGGLTLAYGDAPDDDEPGLEGSDELAANVAQELPELDGDDEKSEQEANEIALPPLPPLADDDDERRDDPD